MTEVQTLHPPRPQHPSLTACPRPIRPFDRRDIPAVAALYMRAYRHTDAPPSRDLCDYFDRVFFSDPWIDLDASPSLVFVDHADRVRGFIGCHPRRLLCKQRTISAVAMGQMMVDPDMRRRGLAWTLGQSVLAGPQTLTYGTTASETAASMWKKMGFWNPPFAGLSWTLPLNSESPARAADHRHRTTSLPRILHTCLDRLFDGVRQVAPQPMRPIRDGRAWSDLHARLLTHVPLRPDTDEPHFNWAWKVLSRSTSKGQPRSCIVCNEHENPIGWVIYFRKQDRSAAVLEIAHLPDHAPDLLTAFAYHAARDGLRRIRGRCSTPQLTAHLVELGAKLTAAPSDTVYQTNDPDVRSAILNGQCFFSEMDSDGWLSFADR